MPEDDITPPHARAVLGAAGGAANGAPASSTDVLADLRSRTRQSLDQVVALTYAELRAIAHRRLAARAPGGTLSTTALVHEAYLKLIDGSRVSWADREHFYAVAARAMRRILVDSARARRAVKRGGERRPVPLEELSLPAEERSDVLVALDEALIRLAGFNERMARVVECRYFGGLTEEETAVALGVSVRTVRREWVKAKGWLYRELYG
jgi:RNA polymerase sigma factor (TIGR02999 family)